MEEALIQVGNRKRFIKDRELPYRLCSNWKVEIEVHNVAEIELPLPSLPLLIV